MQAEKLFEGCEGSIREDTYRSGRADTARGALAAKHGDCRRVVALDRAFQEARAVARLVQVFGKTLCLPLGAGVRRVYRCAQLQCRQKYLQTQTNWPFQTGIMKVR